MKHPNDSKGNQTRDLPACSAVPRPAALSVAVLLQLIKLCSMKLEVACWLSLFTRIEGVGTPQAVRRDQ